MHNYTLPQETNVAQAKSLLADSHYIDDDLLILDEINVNSISENALRMQCLFMALCTEGHARYCVDTKEQEVEAGDVMIVSEGQVLSNYMLSPDCRGVALMMSYDFYNDIINEIHELSALFLFSRMHPVFKLNKNEMHDMLSYFSAIRQGERHLTPLPPRGGYNTAQGAYLRHQQRYIPHTDPRREAAQPCREHFHGLHQACGKEFQAKKACGMVCQAAVHHA